MHFYQLLVPDILGKTVLKVFFYAYTCYFSYEMREKSFKQSMQIRQFKHICNANHTAVNVTYGNVLFFIN